MKKTCSLIVPFTCISIFVTNLYASRDNFDHNWKFTQQDVAGAESVEFDDSNWRILDLPHDWGIEGEYSETDPEIGGRIGYLPTGIGWYRKSIRVPESWEGKHVEITFDGVCMNSTVWANGKLLGHRPFGWISFSYDISAIATEADSITFAVRVDNSKQPSARWYSGSGIYAHTWIDVKDKLHIPNDGVFVRTQMNRATISTEISNTGERAEKFTLRTSIRDASGKSLGEAKRALGVSAGDRGALEQTVTINSPRYWSPHSPQLYTLHSEIISGGTIRDRRETRFGFRDLEWRPETGLWLNGENTKLRGMNNHQDAGALGVAVPDKIKRFRLQQLKDMGVNSIRTAHNPFTPEFYHLCDELGIIVMDEIFDGWKKWAEHDYAAHHFDEWWRRDLTDWIKRNRNHPSIFIYAVGAGRDPAHPLGKEMVELCHQLDNTRPVTSTNVGADHMDVLGLSGPSEQVGFLDAVKRDRVIVATENPHTWPTRGYYRTQTWYRKMGGDRHLVPDLTDEEIFTYDWIADSDRPNPLQIFGSSYDNHVGRISSRKSLAQLRDTPYYAGAYRWTGHDYLGESGKPHGGWPFRLFMGGAIDVANFEKDLYYLYQSQWTTTPMLHILPHWTHLTMERGTKIPVWVYTNCDTVELFLNGESLGSDAPGSEWNQMQCQWMVPWTPGELEAIGKKNGAIVARQTVRTAGPPARVALSIDGDPLAARGKDIVQIRAATLDANGNFYPYGEHRTHFTAIGPASIRALDNGSPVDVEKHYRASSRKAFMGLTRAYIESTDESGDITLLASSILGVTKLLHSNLISIDVGQLTLRGASSKQEVEIFYTTDGSNPIPASTAYTSPFPVTLGTTVKALIQLDGNPVQTLEQRFASDEGLVWK